ncbi:uncharacterized protein LOC120261100 isoform X1 [Dioscorea cayenensis subsp. rotundata]|uniref:Uncharacterized protein LOC120261100 isoform X1 n=1 Tax=Dioscorea cayennensis subsp. rotundata TaxID=55577 RepID=A0AB40BCN1_DIOCR|nr:uncharacterized protein LOC120261100 isoform X1 [Dioscorea cayenensis subsp. rotundata]
MDSAFTDWAEGICNKLEKLCEENAIIQNSSKYVNAVGEHMQTVLEEIARDWLGSNGSHIEPFSELSLEPNISSEDCKSSTCMKMASGVSPVINPATTTEIYEDSTSRHDSSSVGNSNSIKMVSAVSPMEATSPACSPEACENLRCWLDSPVEKSACIKTSSAVFPAKIISPATSTEPCENSTSRPDSSSVENSTCIKMGSDVSPTETIIPATSTDDSKNLSQKDACDEDHEKLIHHKLFSQCKASELNRSFDGEENANDVLGPVFSANDLSGSKDDQKERVLTHSAQISPTKAYGTNIFIGDHDQQNEMKNLVASVQPPEFGIHLVSIAESSGYFYREETLGPIFTYSRSTPEIAGEFEDVNLNDSSGDNEDYVLDFISHLECKDISFKKKFRDAIISKMGLRRRRVYNEADSCFMTTDEKLQNEPQAASIARANTTKSTLDLSDSDWELL